MPWQLLVVALLALVFWGAPEVVASLTNGPIVGRTTTLDPSSGLVPVDPYELAAAANLDVQVYALARCMSSEHANDPNAYLIAVGWAVVNYAQERGQTVLELLTAGAGTSGDGWFGEQKAAAGTKYASTARDPHRRHVEVATGVVYATVPDPTAGATHFFSPRAQDQLAAKAAAGDERYTKYSGKDSEYIFRTWAAPGGLYHEGATPVVPSGIDGEILTLWRRLA